MRESKLTTKGFKVSEVDATQYTKDGVSFISVGDSTAKNQCKNEKTFEERLEELKAMYDGSDFDFITILKLENEYNEILLSNPDHTKKRSEILEMRRRLIDRLIHKSRW